jgi:hypothetical protein
MSEELQTAMSELLAAIQQLRAEQAQREERMLNEINQAVHESETKLLTAFIRWQEN